MVDLFEHIGVGRWFRVLTGAVELSCALLFMIGPTVFNASALLAATMLVGVGVHLFIVGGNPLPVITLCLLTAGAAWRTPMGSTARQVPNFSHR